MSTGARQEQFGGDGFPAHLTTEPDHKTGNGLEIDPDRGLFYCRKCETRITRNTKNHTEYGHLRGCPHKREPEEVV